MPRNFIAFFGYDINYITLGTYINRGVFASISNKNYNPAGGIYICDRVLVTSLSVFLRLNEERIQKKKIISLAVPIVIKNNLTDLYTVRVFQPRDIILSRWTQLIRNECNNPQLCSNIVNFTERLRHLWNLLKIIVWIDFCEIVSASY